METTIKEYKKTIKCKGQCGGSFKSFKGSNHIFIALVMKFAGKFKLFLIHASFGKNRECGCSQTFFISVLSMVFNHIYKLLVT